MPKGQSEDNKGAIRRYQRGNQKIPKEQSEAVNRRSTDNTMVKRKRTKGQTTIYKTLYTEC
jgi:hypothetical protein